MCALGILQCASPEDEAIVRQMLVTARPEGVVCANDLNTARLMKTLPGMNVGIPGEVRIVGMDKAKYASLLPLASIDLDGEGIGMVSMVTMLERLKHMDLSSAMNSCP